MNEIPFFQRVALAFVAFFAVLFNRQFAVGVKRLRAAETAELPGPEPKPALPAQVVPVLPQKEDDRAALHLLSILQREGRFVDFLQEDVAAYGDADVGAAARAVHEGCRKALGTYFKLEPVLTEPEGANVTVPAGFDAGAIRLTGNVVGQPPFKGSLKHHGWKAKEVNLPNRPKGLDPAVIVPAEVELP